MRHDGMIIAISLTCIVQVCSRATVAVAITVLAGRGERSLTYVQQRKILDAGNNRGGEIIRRSSRGLRKTSELERHYSWLQVVEKQGT